MLLVKLYRNITSFILTECLFLIPLFLCSLSTCLRESSSTFETLIITNSINDHVGPAGKGLSVHFSSLSPALSILNLKIYPILTTPASSTHHLPSDTASATIITMHDAVQNPQISSIVNEIDSAAKAIDDGEKLIKGAQKRALLAARNLVATLEDPTETLFQHVFGVSASFIILPVVQTPAWD